MTFMPENDRITSMKVKEKDKRNVSEQIIQFAILTNRVRPLHQKKF